MSFHDDATLVFIAGAGKDDKIYNLKPGERLDETELVTNGDFSSSTGWTMSDTSLVEIANGYAEFKEIDDYNILRTEPQIMENGKTYRISFEITDWSQSGTGAPQLIVQESSNRNPTIAGIKGPGKYSFTYDALGDDGIGNLNAGDDSRLVFKNSGPSGKNNKLSFKLHNVSVKEVLTKGGDFTFTRGTNKAATRVGPDKLIDVTTEQFLFNTIWSGVTAADTAPTGYTGNAQGNGTFNVTDTPGQLKFDVPAVGAGEDRTYVISPTETAVGLWTMSVYVDEVTGTAPNVNQVITCISNDDDNNSSKILLRYLKDNTPISNTTAVEAGHRYSVSLKTVDDAYFRFGIGTSSDVTAVGSVTLSRPQVERSPAPTPYLENLSFTENKFRGLADNEPRFDYYGSTTRPALLLEPERRNLVLRSASDPEGTNNVNLAYNHNIAPDGTQSGLRITTQSADANSRIRVRNNNSFTLINGEAYAISAFIKNTGSPANARPSIACRIDVGGAGTLIRQGYKWTGAGNLELAIDDTASLGTRFSIIRKDYGNGWWRIGFCFDATDTTGNFEIDINRNTSNVATGQSIATWGWQFEQAKTISGGTNHEAKHITSYIPTNGQAVTRPKDEASIFDLSSYGLTGKDVTYFLEFRNNQDIPRDINSGRKVFIGDSSNPGSVRIYRPSDLKKQLVVVWQDNTDDEEFDPSGNDITSDNPKVVITRVKSSGRHRCYVDGERTTDDTNTNYDDWKKLQISGHMGVAEIRQILALPYVLSEADAVILSGGTHYDSVVELGAQQNYTIYD